MNGLKVLTYAALVSVLADCGDHDSSTETFLLATHPATQS